MKKGGKLCQRLTVVALSVGTGFHFSEPYIKVLAALVTCSTFAETIASRSTKAAVEPAPSEPKFLGQKRRLLQEVWCFIFILRSLNTFSKVHDYYVLRKYPAPVGNKTKHEKKVVSSKLHIVLLSQPASLGERSSGCYACWNKKKAVYDKPNLAWFRFLVFQKSSFAKNKTRFGSWLGRVRSLTTFPFVERKSPWRSDNAHQKTCNLSLPAVDRIEKGNFQIRFGIPRQLKRRKKEMERDNWEHRLKTGSVLVLFNKEVKPHLAITFSLSFVIRVFEFFLPVSFHLSIFRYHLHIFWYLQRARKGQGNNICFVHWNCRVSDFEIGKRTGTRTPDRFVETGSIFSLKTELLGREDQQTKKRKKKEIE